MLIIPAIQPAGGIPQSFLKSLLKILGVRILGKPFLSSLNLHGNSECGILNIKSYGSS